MSFKVPNIPPIMNTLTELLMWAKNFFNRIANSDYCPTYVISFDSINMDTSSSFTVDLNDLSTKSILGFQVVVFNNDLSKKNDGSLGMDNIELNSSTGIITLTVTSGGIFDNSDYNNASGKVIVWT